MDKILQQSIRRWLLLFMVALFISGLTAMPAEMELRFLTRLIPPGTYLGDWLDRVLVGVTETNRLYPFIGYGYDWLAFAHFVLALLFIGPYRDPVRNRWVIEFGLIACVLILPFALVAGEFRGIPWGWRFIDCGFGVVGLLPLLIVYRKIRLLNEAGTGTAA